MKSERSVDFQDASMVLYQYVEMFQRHFIPEETVMAVGEWWRVPCKLGKWSQQRPQLLSAVARRKAIAAGGINSVVVTWLRGSESNMHRDAHFYHRCEYRATESHDLSR